MRTFRESDGIANCQSPAIRISAKEPPLRGCDARLQLEGARERGKSHCVFGIGRVPDRKGQSQPVAAVRSPDGKQPPKIGPEINRGQSAGFVFREGEGDSAKSRVGRKQGKDGLPIVAHAPP